MRACVCVSVYICVYMCVCVCVLVCVDNTSMLLASKELTFGGNGKEEDGKWLHVETE